MEIFFIIVTFALLGGILGLYAANKSKNENNDEHSNS
jgi:hypothetical protein